MKPLEAKRLKERAWLRLQENLGARSSCRGEWSRMKNVQLADRFDARIARLQKVYDRAKAVWDEWTLPMNQATTDALATIDALPVPEACKVHLRQCFKMDWDFEYRIKLLKDPEMRAAYLRGLLPAEAWKHV